MNKGIVMEQHRKYIIVMTEDGLFSKAHPIRNCKVGEEVEYEPYKETNRLLHPLAMKNQPLSIRMVAIACIFALLIVPTFLVMNQDHTYAYVDIDINPSMELEIDREYRVVAINPLNEDASTLMEELDIKGKKVERAIEIVIQQAELRGLYNINKNVLVGINNVEGNETSLLHMIDDHFSQDSDIDWKIVTMQIPSEIRNTAKESDQSMNQALAESIEEDRLLDEMADSVSNDEQEIINSFYQEQNGSEEEMEEVSIDEVSSDSEADESKVSEKDMEDKDSSDMEQDKVDNELHPSKLKGKNGELNSQKKNKLKKEKETPGNKLGKNKGNHKHKFKGKNKQKYKHENNSKKKMEQEKQKGQNKSRGNHKHHSKKKDGKRNNNSEKKNK
ncbi:Anti-sigma factor N-terminus [Oceanobacillus limi]|uniref:Anti-sigma factor N-terminus n=1 Tax=Oceanobacillus limi TaxID=930131 RepID=A0A1H9YIZ2_9BACI|nr:anti-sigma factor domain-containing protein [Oceanobacillus limi]SES68459.1 Anti-sigma factor N-terminus [Oceanobacillus limi]